VYIYIHVASCNTQCKPSGIPNECSHIVKNSMVRSLAWWWLYKLKHVAVTHAINLNVVLTESHNKKWLYWVLDCLRNIRTHPGTQLCVPKEILLWGTQSSWILLLRVMNFFCWQNSVAVFHYHYWCHVALHYMWFIWKYIWLQHWSFVSKTFIWYLLKSSNTCCNSSSALPFALSPSHMSDECTCTTLKNFPFRIVSFCH